MKIELKKAGEEATLAIKTVEIKEGTSGNMVIFHTKEGDELAISEKTVERQLTFMGCPEIADAAGGAFHFSRKANNTPGHQPYWNIRKATKDDLAKVPHEAQAEDYSTSGYLPGDENYETPKPNGKPVIADALVKKGDRDPRWNDMVKRYTESFNAATDILGRDFGSDSVIAATATLFIQRMKAGV